jgi:hypothetical protein
MPGKLGRIAASGGAGRPGSICSGFPRRTSTAGSGAANSWISRAAVREPIVLTVCASAARCTCLANAAGRCTRRGFGTAVSWSRPAAGMAGPLGHGCGTAGTPRVSSRSPSARSRQDQWVTGGGQPNGAAPQTSVLAVQPLGLRRRFAGRLGPRHPAGMRTGHVSQDGGSLATGLVGGDLAVVAVQRFILQVRE